SNDRASVTIYMGNLSQSAAGGTAPSNITGFTITVSAPGMATITQTFSAGVTSATLDVTPGSNRLVSVVAAIDPSDPGVLLSYKGSEQVSLSSGETKTVPLTMKAYETKLLIPDYMNNRLVQINSMSGDDAAINATWTELLGTSAGFSSNGNFRPFDVDIDSQGRIYIANAYGGSGMGNNRVARVDNISGANALSFSEASYDGSVVAIAVDRTNDLVYYATNSGIAAEKLYKSNLDNSVESSLTISSGVEAINRVEGISVDADGNLYLAGENTSFQDRVFKYNPSTQQVTHSYSADLSASNGPLDIMVKNGSIYVANPEGANGYRILQFSADFGSLTAAYGSDTGSISTVGYFYGGERFLGTMNPYFYIMDEDFGGGSPDRVIYMEDMNGTGWKTYGQSGSSSPGYFGFMNGGS
ncbi:MAG: hypothetical protein GY754_18965, partial [bacterium]|nr:hypothetical protein [bacterium]